MLLLNSCGCSRKLCQIGKHSHQRRFEQLAKCVVYWTQLQVHQCVIEVRHSRAVQLIAQAIPRLLERRTQFTPIEEDVTFVSVKFDSKTLVCDLRCPLQILKACQRIAKSKYN